MNKSAFNELLAFFTEYNVFLEKAVQAQNEKIEALLTHDVEIIEKSAAKQQAVGMQFAKYEERRQKLMDAAGVSGATFEQLVDFAQDEEKQKVRDLYHCMQDRINQIKFLNGKAMHLVETNLKVIDMELPVQERRTSRGYSGDGKTHSPKKGTSLFETKI
ncbi:MAG: flagellar export chaperone FlgN [Oscillospiraceae bacterium]|nr:flagellar export chaperone FlgN [Oscillospiraceae bacterium]